LILQKFEKPIYITKPLLPDIKDFKKNIEDIWESCILTNRGKHEILLEEELKKYLCVNNISLFNNGTTAIIVAIKSLGLSGEIITPVFNFPAAPNSISWCGISPVFCDIEEDTCNIDINKIESLITDKTTAILPVHVFGNPCNIDTIQSIARKYSLRVLYDASHTFGVKINDIGIGTFGDMSTFSFHATKTFNTFEGGAISFNDGEYIDKLYLLKNFGIDNVLQVKLCGINGKINEIQSLMGRLVLKLVDSAIEKRKRLYDIYFNELSINPLIKFLNKEKEVLHNYQYMPIKIIRDRDVVYDVLKEFNVFSRKYFYPLCSNYPFFNCKEKFPVAEKISEQILTLPIYSDLEEESVYKICKIINNIL